MRRGEPIADYHGDPATLSKSGIWCHYDDGPVAFYERYLVRTAPPLESSSLSHGTLLHEWLEVGDEAFWQGLYVAPKSTLTPTGLLGKQAKEHAAEHAPGKKLISPDDADQLRAEIAALASDPQFQRLQDGLQESEVSIRFDVDDMPCRCRPDQICLVDGQATVVDLKTSRERGLLRNFHKSVLRYGYHAQDWLYQRGMEAMGLEPRPLVFVAVSTATAEVLICTLPQELTAIGGRIVRESLADIRLRLDLDCWLPDQHGEIVQLPVPAYAMSGGGI